MRCRIIYSEGIILARQQVVGDNAEEEEEG